MIHIQQRPVPRSRTQTGSLWEASTEIDGKTYSATSRHGAPQALARVLLAEGVADMPVEGRSEVCVFDNGTEIRTEQLRGCIRYRSLHTMAKTTFEEGDRPLHRARFKERPQNAVPVQPGEQEMRFKPPAGILGSAEQSEGLAADGGTGQKCVSSPAVDVLEPSPRETQALAPPAETRRCDGCGGDFLPARPWSRFCSSACRLRAHRRLPRQDQNVPPVVERPRANSGQEALAE
jgi:hypothetical protein